MYELIFSKSYLKKEKNFFKKHKDLIERYQKILHILRVNPNHPSLRLHKLKGNLKEYYSVSLNMQYRLVINFIIKDNKILFIDIGTHKIYERLK